MRVLGGIWQGMEVEAPKGLATRPTSAKVREAVLSAIRPLLPGASVLELFAGSGAFSWEALSQGAARAVLIERAEPAVRVLKVNYNEACRRSRAEGIPDPKVTIVKSTVESGLQRMAPNEPIDIVWADPPYAQLGLHLDYLLRELPKYLADKSLFLVESDKAFEAAMVDFVSMSAQWQLVKQRTYGNTMIHRLEYERGR